MPRPSESASLPKGRPLPLTGVTVLDLSHVYNGPYATFLMALAGAKVIKVEPRSGEHLRSRGDSGGAAMAFAMLNSNKLCMTLDLKAAEGVRLLRELAQQADVLVENFSPGTMERLGVGSETLTANNPRLIYASSSGYGKTGPYRDFPAMDLVMQAMSGIIAITGEPDRPPVKAGAAVCDFSAGVHLYGAIMTALYERERTGLGRVVDVSMQDSIYASMASNIGMHWASNGTGPTRTGNRHGGLGISPYNVYAAADGYVVLNAPGDHHFRSILDVMGHAALKDDARFATRSSRVQHMDEVDELIEEWTRRNPRDTIAKKMQLAGVPCAPVRELTEVMNDENMHARGSLQRLQHPDLGEVVLPHSPMRYDGSALLPLEPSHRLGADTRSLLAKVLGKDDREIERLAAAGIV